MLRLLSWPGHSRSRRQLSRRSSPGGAWHREGGYWSACIPWSSGRWIRSQNTCVTGEAGISQHPQKEVQSWPQRHRNIAWEPELCSSSHQVAFRLPPAARWPYDFPVPTVPVTQNAFLSTSGAPVTTNRPLPSSLYVFYSAVSGHQHCSLLRPRGLSSFCVFFASPSPTKLAVDSFLSFLLKFNRRSIWLDGVNCPCPFWAMHFGLSCFMGSWSTCWLANWASSRQGSPLLHSDRPEVITTSARQCIRESISGLFSIWMCCVEQFS